MVYGKDYDSSKDVAPQGGRFASASQNIKNKANTARLQGEKTFQVMDKEGNVLQGNTAEFTAQQKQQQQRQQEIQRQQQIQQNKRETVPSRRLYQGISPNEGIPPNVRVAKRQALYQGISDYEGLPQNIETTTKYQVTTPDGKVKTFNSKKKADRFAANYGSETQVNQIQGPQNLTQKEIDDQNRAKLKIPSESKIFGDYRIGDVPVIGDIARSFEKEFELKKLPEERSGKPRAIPGINPDYFSLPSNQALAGYAASPVGNFLADIDNLGKAVAKELRGQSGFEPSKTGGAFGIGKGLPVPKEENYKVPTASGKILSGQKVNLKSQVERATIYGDITALGLAAVAGIGSANSGLKSFTPKDTNIFKNFKSETVRKPKGGGGTSESVRLAGPATEELPVGTMVPRLVKPKSATPSIFKPQKTSQVAVKEIRIPNEKGGFDKIRIAKNLDTKDVAALASRTKNEFINVKKAPEVKINKIGEPEEYVKGQGPNVDIKTFFRGNLKFERIQKKGFEQINITDLTKGTTTSRTSINLNAGKPSKAWIQITKGQQSSLNDVFQTNKNAQVEAYKKNIVTTKIKENEQLFSSGRKPKSGQPGLLQKSAVATKTQSVPKVDLRQLEKLTGFKKMSVNLGKGTGYFVPVVGKRGGFGIFSLVKERPKKETKPKRRPEVIPFMKTDVTPKTLPRIIPNTMPLIIPGQTPTTKTDIIPDIPPAFPTTGSGTRETPPPEIPFRFPPFGPKTNLSSFLFGDSESLRRSYAAYGISSDINIKTLPTYSRYSSGKDIFRQQMKEDKKIQELFYGKKGKTGSKKSKSKRKKKR